MIPQRSPQMARAAAMSSSSGQIFALRWAARRTTQAVLLRAMVIATATLFAVTAGRRAAGSFYSSQGDAHGATAFSHPKVTFRQPSASPAAMLRQAAGNVAMVKAGKRLLVLGGNGFVGREVCKLAVDRGYEVTSLSRRGENPEPGDELLDKVRWIKGNAADEATMNSLVGESDAVVHAIGLLFDANSGLTNLNIIVSGSKSVPDTTSTYDTITRKTAFNLIKAIRNRWRLPFSPPTPVMFVSAAEAGWPDVAYGPQVEEAAPAWLKEYLVAKRAVEKELTSFPDAIRPAIFRPSLIWSWTKFDVLPVIPVFNVLNALGIPFIDKTVTVSTLSKAIIAGLEDDSVLGVQRFEQMEQLENKV